MVLLVVGATGATHDDDQDHELTCSLCVHEMMTSRVHALRPSSPLDVPECMVSGRGRYLIPIPSI